MDESPLDIERVVREVLRRLRGIENGTIGENGGELILTDRLVTCAALEGKLNGVRSVKVPPRTTVTPSARDLLRAAGVSLAVSRRAGEVKERLTIGMSNARFNPASLTPMLEQQGIEVKQAVAAELTTMIDKLAASVVKGDLALLFTGDLPAAVCLANRVHGVRAASAGDAAETARAVSGVAANFLIVDPAGKSLFQLNRMATEFCRPGPRQCPAAWRQRLE